MMFLHGGIDMASIVAAIPARGMIAIEESASTSV